MSPGPNGTVNQQNGGTNVDDYSPTINIQTLVASLNPAQRQG